MCVVCEAGSTSQPLLMLQLSCDGGLRAINISVVVYVMILERSTFCCVSVHAGLKQKTLSQNKPAFHLAFHLLQNMKI